MTTKITVRKVLVITFFLFTTYVQAGNKGHRLGGGKGSYSPKLPENSLIALEALYEKYGEADKAKWGTIEFDLRETKDGVLVARHDGSILGPTGKIFYVEELEFYQLRELVPEVPTILEVLESIKRFQPRTKVMVEIKHLQSDEGRETMITLVDDLKNTHPRIWYGAFRKHFRDSFPDNRKEWCKRLKEVVSFDLYGRDHC